MKIAILDDVQDAVRDLDCFKLLDGHEIKIFTTSAVGLGQLAIRLAPFEALVLIRERTHFSRALLQKLPNLKVISQTGKVSGHIDLQAAQEFGITVLEGSGDPTAPAELTWALIMASTRKIPQYAANLRQGLWQTASINPALNQLGTRLAGKTLGIWGYGKIGRLVAGYGKAFGMHVMIWGSENSRQAASQNGYTAAQTKHQFFSEADVLTLHLRLNDVTSGCVTGEDFSRMKQDSLFVNTSRFELVDKNAFFQALQSGQAAALDVFDTEPLPKDSPLLQFPKLLLTPHLGYVEKQSYEIYFATAFKNILNYLNSPS
ncbi:D-3-phosphoglycerate dehydrogenase [Oxalobacteraceae bacterium GrIS 2.11]